MSRPMAPAKVSRFQVLFVSLSLLSVVACKPGGPAKATKPVEAGDRGKSVARIDDTVITVGEVQDLINKQAPFVRTRYMALDKRKEFLDNLIRFEVMAKEAEKRGYDKDPEVLRVMNQQMVSKFLQKDFEPKLKVENVPDADVEKYYKDHPEEYNRPEEVRVSELLVKDKARADKVAADARAADHKDPKPFRDLVTKYSEDEDSKQRGGDLTSFDRTSTMYPKPIIDAAFELKEVGDISPPIKVEKGYAVLRLTQRRAAYSRPLAEVKRQIQQRLFRDVRTKAMDDLVAELKAKYGVTIDEANLSKVAIDNGAIDPRGAPGPSPGMFLPPPRPGAPGMPPGATPSPPAASGVIPAPTVSSTPAPPKHP